MTDEASTQRIFTPTKPQQELIDRLGLEILPNMDGRAVNRAIDRAMRAHIGRAQRANPALTVGSSIILDDGSNCRIVQMRDHRVQLTGERRGWVTFFEIENATAALKSE